MVTKYFGLVNLREGGRVDTVKSLAHFLGDLLFTEHAKQNQSIKCENPLSERRTVDGARIGQDVYLGAIIKEDPREK